MFLQAMAAIASAVFRPPALLLGSLLGFGILIPYRMGITFTESRMLLAYAFLPMLFMATPVAMGIPRVWHSARRLYAWLAAAIALGFCIWLVFLLTALLTVTIAIYPVPVIYVTARAFFWYAALCLGSCWFAGSLAAYLALALSPNVARDTMRAGFLMFLLWLQFGGGLVSPRWRWYTSGIGVEHAMAVLILLAAGLTNALRAGVRPTADE